MNYKKAGLALLGLFILSTVGGVILMKSGSASYSKALEADWRLLGKMDYIEKNIPDSVAKIDNQLVKVPGFMVPLEDNMRLVTEFLLVPSPQACIHVPPPPPNQMVYVKMEKGIPAAYGPIWVYGTMHVKSQKHMYGEASYQMTGLMVEPYK